MKINGKYYVVDENCELTPIGVAFAEMGFMSGLLVFCGLLLLAFIGPSEKFAIGIVEHWPAYAVMLAVTAVWFLWSSWYLRRRDTDD